jgi:hypothetical protein
LGHEDITKRFSETNLVSKAGDGFSTLTDKLHACVEDSMKTDAKVMDIKTSLHQILIEAHDALKYDADLKSTAGKLLSSAVNLRISMS